MFFIPKSTFLTTMWRTCRPTRRVTVRAAYCYDRRGHRFYQPVNQGEFTFLHVWSYASSSVVNLIGFLGGRRPDPEGLFGTARGEVWGGGTPPHRKKGLARGLCPLSHIAPSTEKNWIFWLAMACFREFWAVFVSLSSLEKCRIFCLKWCFGARRRCTLGKYQYWIRC